MQLQATCTQDAAGNFSVRIRWKRPTDDWSVKSTVYVVDWRGPQEPLGVEEMLDRLVQRLGEALDANRLT